MNIKLNSNGDIDKRVAAIHNEGNSMRMIMNLKTFQNRYLTSLYGPKFRVCGLHVINFISFSCTISLGVIRPRMQLRRELLPFQSFEVCVSNLGPLGIGNRSTASRPIGQRRVLEWRELGIPRPTRPATLRDRRQVFSLCTLRATAYDQNPEICEPQNFASIPISSKDYCRHPTRSERSW